MNTTINIDEEILSPGQKEQYDFTNNQLDRLKSKAEIEKEAKKNGTWDYRNNCVIEMDCE